MDDLIEALQIFRRYLPADAPHAPTNCRYDELYIMNVDATTVSDENTLRLFELGFFEHEGGFMSYRFGSA